METIDQLFRQQDRMRDTAIKACTAAEDFARAANGVNGYIIPAPTAYDLLGNIKGLLRNLQEVTNHLPRGLAASLTDPRIEISDRNPSTGEERDPSQSVALASAELRALTAALAAATELAEAAQNALNAQEYNEAP